MRCYIIIIVIINPPYICLLWWAVSYIYTVHLPCVQKITKLTTIIAATYLAIHAVGSPTRHDRSNNLTCCDIPQMLPGHVVLCDCQK